MDVFHDNSHRNWVQIAARLGTKIPDYVWQHEPDEKTAAELDSELFADPVKRVFPLDSKAATWLSAAYFAKQAQEQELPYNRDTLAYMRETLTKTAEIYGNQEDIQVVFQAYSEPLTKVAELVETEEDYGWVVKDAAGNVLEKKYAMRDEEEVYKAAEYFDLYRFRYPHPVRRGIAENICYKAASYDIADEELPVSVVREAGKGFPNFENVADELLRRAKIAANEENSLLLSAVNQLLMTDPGEAYSSLAKIAEVISAFDEAEGLTPKYGIEFLSPADFLYEIPVKEAQEAVEDAVPIGKFVFSAQKLAELDPEELLAPLDSTLVEKIKDSKGKPSGIRIKKTIISLSPGDQSDLLDHLRRLTGDAHAAGSCIG